MQGLAQQDDGPILRPHKPVAKPPVATATLLVLCDLACNWKLDGKAQGVIAGGDSAKAKVELGEHLITAATEDGLDKTEIDFEIKAAVQTIRRIALQPVRDARLKAEQEAREKAAREQWEKERLAAEQEARDRAARESTEKAPPDRNRVALAGSAEAWTDSSTGLMWAPTQNAINGDWNGARNYCANLQLGGYSDWRLPTIDELAAIFDRNEGVGSQHIKGGIQIGGAVWGYKAGNAAAGLASYFNFHDGGRYAVRLETTTRATEYTLCVRRSRD